MDSNSTDQSIRIEELTTVETVHLDNSEKDEVSDGEVKLNDDSLSPLLPSTIETNNINISNYPSSVPWKLQSKITSSLKEIVDIYSDQSGSCLNITKGLSIVALIGIFIGIIMPKDTDLPGPVYRYISSMIGYLYFMAWSVSFYPQIITNYQKKSTDGLSTDSTILGILNYTCYAIYNAFFFWDETIRQEYKDRHGADAEITVMSNDVAFAFNALFTLFFTLGQIIYYSGMSKQPASRTCKLIVGLTILFSTIYIVCILLKLPGFIWIDFLYIMATVKLILTIMTYIPQIALNYQRKSTKGFNIWNIIFDFSGGLLSLMQLFFDCLDMNNFSGILGNWAKLILSLITFLFDGFYFLQHYVLYRNTCDDTDNIGEATEEERDFFYNPVEDTDDDGGDEQPLTEIV